MNDYKVIWASETTEPASYGQVKQRIKVEGHPDFFNVFTKEPLKAGDSIFGSFVPKEYNGKVYMNFKFGKRDAAPPPPPVSEAALYNLINLKVIPMLQSIHTDLAAIKEAVLSEGAENIMPDFGEDDPMTKNNPF